MTPREVIRAIEQRGGRKVRQTGSHARYECEDGTHKTTVPMHSGDLPRGTLRSIQRDLASCPHFGPEWLRQGEEARMATRKSVTVDIEQDEDGVWIAHVRQMPSCHTFGRSIAQAKERIREAMQLFDSDDELGKDPQVTFEVKLPREARTALEAARSARAKAEREMARASDATATAARQLTAAGVSTRDAAEMLGLSHQRIHQLVRGR